MGTVMHLKSTNHLQHGIVSEAETQDSLNDPLLALLCHFRLSVFSTCQREEIHVVKSRFNRIGNWSLIKYKFITDGFEILA
jgi:hypothetical protein